MFSLRILSDSDVKPDDDIGSFDISHEIKIK